MRHFSPFATFESLEHRRLFALAGAPTITLINADTDQPVPGFTFDNGAVIDLATHGRRLNVDAKLPSDAGVVGSVRFNYDANPAHAIENTGPYAMAGNSGTNYNGWTPTLGTHTLVVTPYAGTNGTGERRGSTAVTFSVIDSSALPSPTRVNAGGSKYTMLDGRVFNADSNFSGGTKYSSSFSVAGTSDDPLYRTRREGSSFSFSKSVPTGQYLLTLHFAEHTKTANGQRKFDVSAEGKLILDDYDLVAAAGGNKRAVTRQFTVNVTDGALSLSFKGVVSNAVVSGVEIVALPRVVAVPAPLRIDAGSDVRFTDSLGRSFERDTGFTGGAKVTAPAYAALEAGVSAIPYADGPLLYSYREGSSFTFSRAVANGRYTLWLEFAEPDAAALAGQRVFDVTAEGSLALNDYDIVADAGGAQRAVAQRIDVNVADGKLDLGFTGVVGQAMVGAIVMLPTDIPAEVLWHAAIHDSTDPVKHDAYLTAYRVKSQSNLRQMGMAILMYSNENKGKYPPDLATLVRTQDITLDAFANPRIPTPLPRGVASRIEDAAWVAWQDDYVYVGAALRYSSPAGEIVAYENLARTPSDEINVLFVDGHVGVMSRADLVARYGGPTTAPPAAPRPLDVPPAPGDAEVVKSASNLRAIGQAILIYSNENRGRAPLDFGLLYRTQETPPETFVNPRVSSDVPPAGQTPEEVAAWINARTDYLFPAAGKSVSSFDGDDVVAYENPADGARGINVLFGDGHVEFREMRWALEMLAKPTT